MKAINGWIASVSCVLALAGWAQAAAAEPVFAKHIRIEHRTDTGAAKGLEVAEVEVISDGKNVAPRGSVKQSSTSHGQGGALAELAIDGCKLGWGEHRTVAMTDRQPGAWWELEFPESLPVEKIRVFERSDGPWERLQSAWVMALNEKREVIWEQQIPRWPPIPEFTVTPQFPERNLPPAASAAPLPPPLVGLWPAWTAPAAPGETAFTFGRALFAAEAVEIRYGDAADFAAIRLAGLRAAESQAADRGLVLRPADTPDTREGSVRFSGTKSGFRIEAASTLATGAAGPPLLDLVLDAPGQGTARPLFNRGYTATRLDGVEVRGFIGPVAWKKLHAGNAPLTRLSVDLGERRLELDVSKSCVFARLTTEADGSTHLRIEPAQPRAGVRRRCAVEARFLSGAAAAESATAATGLSAQVDQSFFKAAMAPGGGLTLGAGPRRGNAAMCDLLAARLVVEPESPAGASAASAPTNPPPTAVYQPQGEADTFARLAAEHRSETAEATHSVRCLWRDTQSAKPAAVYEVDLTVRPLHKARTVRADLDLTAFSVAAINYSDFKFAECSAQVRAATASDQPIVYSGGTLPQPVPGVRLLQATVRPMDAPDNFYAAVRATVEPLACGSARLVETPDAFLRLELTPEGSDGTGLEAGRAYSLKYRVRLELLSADDAGPIQVGHTGRRCPFFTLPEPAKLELRIPQGAGTLTVTARGDEAGAAAGELPGTLASRGVEQTPFGAEEVWDWTLARQDPGVTAVAIQLKDAAGKVTAERGTEVVQIGTLDQPEIADPALPDEKIMDLELVDEINCGDENDPHQRLDFPGTSAVVQTAIGPCRSMVSERNASMTFEFKVKNLHKAHLIVAEYPDDSFRHMSLGVVEPCDLNAKPEYKNGVSQGNGLRLGPVTGVQMGWPYPVSGKLRTMSLVYWASRPTAYIGVSAVAHTPDWNPDSVGAATVKRILVYEVKGRLPALKIPHAVPGRLLGPYSENSRAYSSFGSDFDADEGPVHGLIGSPAMTSGAHPRFYAKLYNAYCHYIEYLRFTGQNVSVDGMHRYATGMHPGLYPGGFDAVREHYELLARIGAANGVAFMPAVQASHMISPYLERLLRDEQQRCDKDPTALEPTIVFIDKEGKRRAQGLQGAGQPNFVAPEVWGDLVRITEDIARQYKGVPGVAGVTVLAGTWLRPGWDATGGFSGVGSGDQSLDVSYDDRTIARFEANSGVKIPVAGDDAGRYQKRYAWLMANAKEQWIAWRCRMLYELTADMRRAAAAQGLKLSFIWNTHPFENDWWLREAVAGEDASKALLELRKTGYDPALFNRPGESTGCGWWDGLHSRNDWPVSFIGSGVQSAALENGPLRALFDNGPDSAAFLFNAFRESRYPFNSYFKTFQWRSLQIAGGGEQMKFGCLYAWPGPDYGAHDFLRLAAFATPPAFITHTWIDVNSSENDPRDMRRFAAAFRSLPLCRYERLTGNGLDRNLVVRKGEADGKTYLMVANPTWSPLQATLVFSTAGGVRNLVADTVSPVAAGRPLSLELAPYDLAVLRLDDGAVLAGGVAVAPAAAIQQCGAALQAGDDLLAAWGDSLPAADPDRLAVQAETAKARAALAGGDLFGALEIKDGWRLRGALQHLIQPPGVAPAAPPVADADTALLFQFDEGAGAPVEAGAAKRALAGAATYAEGRFGKALAASTLTLPLTKDDPLLNGGSFTLELWVKPAGAADWIASPPWFRLIGVADANNRDMLTWDWNGRDGNAQPIQRINLLDGGNMPTRLQFYTPWRAAAWRHLALVYDKDAQQNNVRLYIDGRLEDQTMSYRPFVPQPGAATLTLGNPQILIDAVRVSSKPRTPQEMGYPQGHDSTSWSRRLRN